jgi:hypothetical protein
MDKPLNTTLVNNRAPRVSEGLVLREIVQAHVFRAQPEGGWLDPEEVCVGDLIVNGGRQFLARRIAGGDAQTAPGSAMSYMSIGTGTGAASLASVLVVGEVLRKILSTNTAGVTAANVYTAVATFGGFADSVTSLALTEAGIWNHANSGLGTMYQHVTYASVVLANSDMLRLTLETNVGSS